MNCRKVISIETKKEIIKKFEDGAKQKDLAIEYDLHKNTVQTILSKKDKIKKAIVAKGVSRLTPRRKPLGDQMENLLLLWLEEQQIKGIPTCQNLIRKKAMLIYQELKNKEPKDQFHNENEEFMASRGWFSKFCKRAGLFKIALCNKMKTEQIDLQNLILCNQELPIFNQLLTKTKKVKKKEVTEIKQENTPLEISTFEVVEEKVLLDHEKPFILNELQALKKAHQEEAKVIQQHTSLGRVVKNPMLTNPIKELLQKWSEVWNFVCQWHPNQTEVIQVGDAFEETAISHFRLLLHEGKEQNYSNQQPLQNSVKQEKFFY